MSKVKINLKSKILLKILSVIILICLIIFIGIFFALKIEKHFIYPLKYDEKITEYSKKYSVDKALVFAMVKVESSFDKNAVSNKGAIGLMQITAETGEYISKMLDEKNYDLKNENTNLKFGTFYLSYLINKFDVIETAICAYNAGEGNVSAWLKDKTKSHDGKTLTIVPFTETQNYLTKILKTYKKYKKLYPNIVDK